MSDESFDDDNPNAIAIVGMAAHLPSARSANEFWQNLLGGVESVEALSDEDLLEKGVSPELIANPNYVKKCVKLPGLAEFDPEFFGLSPKDAGIMDPQHRHFLECCWESLEDANHLPEHFDGSIGVFAGCGMGAYFTFNVLTNPQLVDSVGLFLLRHTGNDKDFLSTRASYCLDLKGPSVNIQTACSTSLVAVHVAAQSLLSGECDMALAGGVTIEVPHGEGHMYHEGEVLSPDGHCRAFDHKSKGTAFGSGAGVVVLRRLEDAIEDNDHIYAVIKGSAVNNDGASKVGYLAPSVDGQTAAMTEAIDIAEIDADTIKYIECHGTGTPMGDPIEISALTQAFAQTTDKNQFCRIGSVKTNIGHLDTAAGVASLIKASHIVKEGKIPASLNFDKPNPSIDFENSPFSVNAELSEWPEQEEPRRAAVNSLGVGGTNAFVIIEEPPEQKASQPDDSQQVLMIAARNKGAVRDYSQNLADFLENNEDVPLADVAYTLLKARSAFECRRVLTVKDRAEAIELLRSADPLRVYNQVAPDNKPSTVFMFPGGGSQYVNMGRDLYDTQPVYREHLDKGIAIVKERVGLDLREVYFAEPDQFESVAERMETTAWQLPAIFIVEYALAQLWMSWGVEPDAMIGHSLGEKAAACLSGVMSFEDALGMVIVRGQLLMKVEEGGMISLSLDEESVRDILPDSLDLATVNAPEMTTVSGKPLDLDAFEKTLQEKEIEYRRVPLKVAPHSRLLDPILEDFGNYVKSIKLSAPTIPFISNRTGDWITEEQATDPNYWVEHLRNTVFFSQGMATLLESSQHGGTDRLLIEVGPGKVLGSLAKQQPSMKTTNGVVPSLRHRDEVTSDETFFLSSVGRVWAAGGEFDSTKLWSDEDRNRVRLPTYAFQRKTYWIEPGKTVAATEQKATQWLNKQSRFEDWFSAPTWQPYPLLSGRMALADRWLVFMDDAGLGAMLTDLLKQAGKHVVQVFEGDAFQQRSEQVFVVAPEHGVEGYSELFKALVAQGQLPERIVHLWSVTSDERFRPGSSFFHRTQERGFYSLFFIAKALGDEVLNQPIHITAAVNGLQQVKGEAIPYPEKATLLGPCRVIPNEFPGITCESIDLVLPQQRQRLLRPSRSDQAQMEMVANALFSSFSAEPVSKTLALRDGQWYEQQYLPVLSMSSTPVQAKSDDNGDAGGGEAAVSNWSDKITKDSVIFMTGGLGGLGLLLADHLSDIAPCRFILLGRSELPARDTWDEYLTTHGAGDGTSQRLLKIKRLEAKGSKVYVAAADVVDRDSLESHIQEAESELGKITGVVHTAGVVRDDLIQMKSQSSVEDVFTPKLHGTLVLDDVFKDRVGDKALDFFILYSSTSSVIAPMGQVDYVAANAFLNAYAEARNYRAKDTATLAVNWGIWNQVGMASESLVKDDEEESSRASDHPLFDRVSTDAHGQFTMTAKYSPETLWIFDEHRTDADEALLPGTGYLELVSAAVREAGEARAYEISDLFFYRPLYIADHHSLNVRVRLKPESDGYHFSVQSAVDCEDGRTGWQTHSEAHIAVVALPEAHAVDVVELDQRCQVKRTELDEKGIKTGQEAHLHFGPRWRVLQRYSIGEGEALAELALPDAYKTDTEQYYLHPALMDLATGYAMELIDGYTPGENLWVPLSYRSVKVYQPLPAEIYSWIRNAEDNSADKELADFDIVLMDRDGQRVAEIERFTIKKLSESISFVQAPKPAAAELEFDAARKGANAQLSPAEMLMRHNLEQGILPDEGMAAIDRVMGAEMPSSSQVVISSLPLDGLIEQNEHIAQERQEEGDGTAFERPNLDSEYVEPRNDIEQTLVKFWEELLGVSGVGVQDSFFDLGGHSLIAVRLFAKIKQTWHVDYPISVLFEAPTIEKCAAMIQEVIGDEAAGKGEGASADGASSQPRHSHLVAMHEGKPGNKTPFFLVAGMFGNVLNLRHIAHLIGTDRAFYGVQAKGLYGGETPHETFEEMARDYIKEIRSVQPNGPYMLGGFSGGGITAYEITRQLQEAGEDVSLLVMLDTPVPNFEPLSLGDKLAVHKQRLSKKGVSYVTEWMGNRYHWEVKRIRNKLGLEEEVALDESSFHNDEIEIAFRNALDLYEFKAMDVHISMFRPKLPVAYTLKDGRVLNEDREVIVPDNGWTPYVTGMDIYEVPGDHDSMVLEPNVRVLAAKIRQCIKKVESGESK